MALPTSVITQASYQVISTKYAATRTQILSALDYLYDAVQTIVNSDYVEPNVDLLPTFYSTYLTIYNDLKPDTRYLASVRAINNHVLTRSGKATVDAYLEDTTVAAVTVLQSWADLCTLTGTDLDAANITP